jgi:carboxymethylenebutenolidase
MAGQLTEAGYVAVPDAGSGPGVLVLHAWWGRTPFFTELCDRLAAAGFVALAPDLYGGPTAATIDEARALIKSMDAERAQASLVRGLEALLAHPARRGEPVGAIGFSMGASWALAASTFAPQIGAVVSFYGAGEGDFSRARAAYQGHFAEQDEWEEEEYIVALEQQLREAGRDVTFYRYPDTAHWFFENNRPEYAPEAAELAWQRTLEFLHARLG